MGKDEKESKGFGVFSTKMCVILEIILAAFVLAGVVVSVVYTVPELKALIESHADNASFMEYLEHIFTIVIGVEFLKMLCRPTSENVLETIIFLVARHMVINQGTPVEDFIAAFTIIALTFAKRILRHRTKEDKSLIGVSSLRKGVTGENNEEEID